MASTVLGRRLTEAHRRQQLALKALTVAQVVRLWPAFDIRDIDASWRRLEPALLALLAQNRAVSGGLAGNYYRAFRQAEEVRGPAPTSAPLSSDWQERARTSLRVTGPIAAKQSLVLRRPDADAVALVRLSGAMSRYVLDAGREVVQDQVKRDEQALGWVRVTDGDPCAFCAMLSSRGPSYKSEETAAFEAHDHCGCEAEPVFSRGQAWPGKAREFQELWNESTRGLGGREALAAFREALSG